MHGMQPLAAKLVSLSYDGDDVMKYHSPQSPAGCALRYVPPADTDDEVPLEIADGQQATRYRVTSHTSAREGVRLGAAATRGARMVTVRASGQKARKLRVVNL